MTAHERIEAAIAALDLARTDINECDYENIDAVLEAGRLVEDATHDLVDEVIRLRKWQQEALPWLSYASDRYWEKNHYHDGVGRNNDLDRLIAEAKGD